MNKTFCIVPFTQLATERNGAYMACCASQEYSEHNVATSTVEEVWNSDYFINLRKSLLAGEQHPNCKTCWESESLNVKSRRQLANEGFNGTIKEFPTSLDIKVGNICNLKCITCNQLASSLHDKEVEEWKQHGIKLPTWISVVDQQYSIKDVDDVSLVAKNLDSALKGATNLMLQGGETFMNPMTINILEYCVEKGYTDLEVEGVINLTSITDANLDLISKFPKFRLLISWDHIEDEKFKYIRYPANYSHFQKNLNKLIERNIPFGISFTLSVFNALNLREIFEQFSCAKFINITQCLAPNYFAAEYLEQKQKMEVIKQIMFLENRNMIDYRTKTKLVQTLLNTPDDFLEVVKERTRVLKIYDTTRKTDYKKLFSYIKEYE